MNSINEFSKELINECQPVEDWFDELTLLREKWDPKAATAVDQAHDLLALWMGFKRFKGELVDQVSDGADQANLTWMEETMQHQGKELAQKAASTLDWFAAWLQSCDNLDVAYETETDPTRIAQLARELLDDLDRAELVELACGRLGQPISEEQDFGIAGCVFRCGADGHLFVAAAGFIRSMDNSFDRSTMECNDCELLLTTEKFRRAVMDVNAAEKTLSIRGVPSPSPQEVREIIATARRNEGRR